jgi:oligoendopeptidase F
MEDARISPTLYFPDAATELETRQALHAQIQPLTDEITQSDFTSLVKVLDRAWFTIGALRRHGAYLKVKSLEDTQDQDVRGAQQAVSADESALSSAINSRLEQVPVSQIPALGPYAFLASKIQRDAKRTLSPDKESYRHSVVLPHEQAVEDAYDRIDESLRATASKKDLSSLDLATRRAALKVRNDAYNSAAPTLATLLATLIDVENRDAIAQGYANAADRKYDSLGLSSQIVAKTLNAVEAQSSVHESYEAVIADHAAKKLGIPSILSTEQDVSSAKLQPIPLAQATKLILEALAPLGPDYTKRFSQLLDPANGRLDLTGGSHRARTGTSIGLVDGPVALYYSGYDGLLPSVGVIAHEGGHAIHRELMNASSIPVYERESPHFLAEGIADFNELLLLDHATKVAQSPSQREYALECLLSFISYELFGSAEETTLERNLYTKAVGHALLDRSQVDTIYQDAVRPYEYWPMEDIGASRNWMRKSLLFEDPLYLVNYLYAAVVAVALYDKAESDPNFAAEYEAFLRRGEYADPQTMLLSIGIRLDDPDVVKPVVKLFRQRTEELRTLYLSDAK